MKLIPGNAQHIGRRNEQQDAFAFTDIEDLPFVSKAGVLVVVADGMGGMAMGREASNIAVRTILDEYSGKPTSKPIADALHDAILRASDAVLRMAKENGLEGHVGTTIAAGVIHNDELFWASVGDSRLYLYHENKLTRLTTDHNYVRELEKEVARGNLSTEEAENHPDRNALTSFLGIDTLDEIDTNTDPIPLNMGDRIILCSDGLYGTLSENEIAQTVSERHPQTACEMLVKKAIAKGKSEQDNITVAMLACCEDTKLKRRKSKLIRIVAAGTLFISLSIALWLGVRHYMRTSQSGLDKAGTRSSPSSRGSAIAGSDTTGRDNKK